MRNVCKKRPCRICRRWFMPNPRVKERQKTCGDAKCKREWHRKRCAEWNKKNSDYYKSNYLQNKIEKATQSEKTSTNPRKYKSPPELPKSRLKSGLPLQYVQEVIGLQHVIIIEYLAQLLIRRLQEALNRQHAVITR